MAESHVVSGLVAKKSELAGLIQHYQMEIHRISFDMKHLDATIKLFDPDFDLRTVKTREFRRRNSIFAQGECLRLTLDALRVAGKSVSTRDIATTIIQRKKLDDTTEMLVQVQKNVGAATKALAKRQMVKLSHQVGIASYWQIV